jgi:hypothetical protein
MVAAGLQAQEAPTKAEITKAVTDLGAGSYQVRQQAQALLKRAGWDAREELAVAAKNRDPEVGDVARKLLADVLPGVTGATPDKLRNLVRYYLDTSEEYSRQSCLETIIAEGPSARAVLFALLDSENQDKARERIRQRMLANRRGLFADQFGLRTAVPDLHQGRGRGRRGADRFLCFSPGAACRDAGTVGRPTGEGESETV